MVLEVRLLGPLEIVVDGNRIPVTGSRLRSLVAILALASDHSVSADQLIDRLWATAPPENPKASLHTAVRRVRSLLGKTAIRSNESGYSLNADQVDATTFAYLVCTSTNREQLDAALALWRGEPFGSDFCEWLTRYERPRLVELWLTAVERRAELDLAAGTPKESLDALQELADRHPLRESLWARLLLALDGCGRSAEALEQYGVIRGHIAEELGVEPGPELRQVFDGLVRGERPLAVPQQLPSDVRRFTGRTEMLAALDEAAAAATGPISTVVLHGEGGAGKTALAVHWAHRVADHFPDGQLYLHLRGHDGREPAQPEEALSDLLRSLGVDADLVPPGLDARAALLRTTLTGRRVLLILDDALNAEQVRPLLPGAGAVVVVTSRNRLRSLRARDGARQIMVEPMLPAEARGLLAAAIAPRQVAPPDDLDDLAALCNRLPLALRIAAEQLYRHELEPAELVRQLHDQSQRLDLLDTGDDPSTDLRAVFSWSYLRLGSAEARLFQLLGCFPGHTITPSVAAALTGSRVVVATRLLHRLADSHLLLEPRTGCFHLHDLLRIYAGERAGEDCPPEELDQAMERVLDWYLSTAQAASEAIQPDPSDDTTYLAQSTIAPLEFGSAAAATDWFVAEEATLMALLRMTEQREWHGYTWRLAWHIGIMQALAPYTGDVVGVAERGVAAVRRLGDPHAAYISLNNAACGYERTGHHEDANATFVAAIESAEQIGHRGSAATIRSNLSVARMKQGELDRAVADLELALADARAALSAPLTADTLKPSTTGILINLGNALTAIGRTEEAVVHTSQALAEARDGENLVRQILCLVNLAEQYDQLDRMAEAESSCDEALTLLTRISAPTYTTAARWLRGRLHLKLGRTDAARQTWLTALAEAEPEDPQRDQLSSDLAALDQP